VTTLLWSNPILMSETGGLPPGLTFADNGDGTATISGIPTGSPEAYHLTISAKSGPVKAVQARFLTTVS
jgi:hypothetical protein